MSLNFRPYHDCSTTALRLHQIFVLMGLRPSIVSVLRGIILPEMSNGPPPTLEDLRVTLAQPKVAPCYLILCDGRETVVIERDLTAAKTRSAKNFIVQTNHDTVSAGTLSSHPLPPPRPEQNRFLGMEEFLQDSEERQECLQQKWDRIVRIHHNKIADNGSASVSGQEAPALSEETLRRWVCAFPTMNESTHFSCILDPVTGTIRWLARGVGE